MSNLTQTNAIESALMHGDLSKLTSDQRLSYFKNVCESLGLNYLTKPFEFITLNGKLTLYAKRDATDQLRKIHKVSISISERQKIDDVYVVTAKAIDSTGRVDESTGAVNVNGLKGHSLANAFMTAETKAKRRVTLSICGLGMLDETEVESIQVTQQQDVKKEEIQQIQSKPSDFVIPFGKFKGQKIGDLDMYDLNSYVSYIQDDAIKKGKTIQGVVAEFMHAAGSYLDSIQVKKEDEINF